jgi:hypothetical protein
MRHLDKGRRRRPALLIFPTLSAVACVLMAWALFTTSPAGAYVAGVLVLLIAAALVALAGAALVDAAAYLITLIRRVSRGSCTTR